MNADQLLELPDDDDLPEEVDIEDLPLSETLAIVKHEEFSFDGRAGSTQEIPLATGIDASRWVSGTVLVVLSAKAGWAARAVCSVVVQACAFDPCEPNVEFLGPQLHVTESAELNGVPVPALSVGQLPTPLPATLRVVLIWQQTTPEASVMQTLTLSVYLVGTFHGRRPSYQHLSDRSDPSRIDSDQESALPHRRAGRRVRSEVADWFTQRLAKRDM